MFKNTSNILLTGIIFFLSGVYIFVFSESGILERNKYEEKRRVIVSKINALKDENSRLEAAARVSGAERISDEDLARAGYVKKGSKLIFNKTADGRSGLKYQPEATEDIGQIEISHLRVVWIVLSSLTVFLLIGSRYRKRDKFEQ